LTGDRRSDRRRELGRVENERLGPNEPEGLRAGLVPVRLPPSGVDRLAVVKVVRDDIRATGGPHLVGDHELAMSVGEGDFELGDHPQLVAVECATAQERELAAVPPVSDRDGDDTAVLEERGYVVRAVAKPPLVRAPTRAEYVITDRTPVDRGFEDAEAADVEHRRLDLAVPAVYLYLRAEER
jgi:hypothetical protein